MFAIFPNVIRVIICDYMSAAQRLAVVKTTTPESKNALSNPDVSFLSADTWECVDQVISSYPGRTFDYWPTAVQAAIRGDTTTLQWANQVLTERKSAGCDLTHDQAINIGRCCTVESWSMLRPFMRVDYTFIGGHILVGAVESRSYRLIDNVLLDKPGMVPITVEPIVDTIIQRNDDKMLACLYEVYPFMATKAYTRAWSVNRKFCKQVAALPKFDREQALKFACRDGDADLYEYTRRLGACDHRGAMMFGLVYGSVACAPLLRHISQNTIMGWDRIMYMAFQSTRPELIPLLMELVVANVAVINWAEIIDIGVQERMPIIIESVLQHFDKVSSFGGESRPVIDWADIRARSGGNAEMLAYIGDRGL